MKHLWGHICILGILSTNNLVSTRSFHSPNFGIFFDDADGITYEYDEDSGYKDNTRLFETHNLDKLVNVNGSYGIGELSLCPDGKKPYIGRLIFSGLGVKLDKPPNFIQVKIELRSTDCLYSKLQSGINIYLNIRGLTLGNDDVLTISYDQNKHNIPRSKSFTSNTSSSVLDGGTLSFGQMLIEELPSYISLNHTSPVSHLRSDAGFIIDYSFVSTTAKAGYTCLCPSVDRFIHSESLKEHPIISCPETWSPSTNESDPSGPHNFRCEDLTFPDPCCPLPPTAYPTKPSPIKPITPFTWSSRPSNTFNQHNDFQSVSIILGVTAGVLLVAVIIFAIVTYRVRMEQTRQAAAGLAAREQHQGQGNGGMVVTDEEPPPVYGAPPTYAEAMQGESVVVLRGFGDDEEDGCCDNQPPVEIVGNGDNTASYSPESGSTEPLRNGGTVNVGYQPDGDIMDGLPDDKAQSSRLT